MQESKEVMMKREHKHLWLLPVLPDKILIVRLRSLKLSALDFPLPIPAVPGERVARQLGGSQVLAK